MKRHFIILGLLLASHVFVVENVVINCFSIFIDYLSFYINYVSIYINYVSIYINDIIILANCFTFFARFGFNIRAQFGLRLMFDGLSYNYLDGYVLRDSIGDFASLGTSFLSITQNWGYDN